MVLDPVISVHPDYVFFEAFSKDESSYANLQVHLNEFELYETPQCGTTNIDFSKKLGDEFLRLRSSKPLELTINPEGFAVETITRPSYLEKKIDLPESWFRGFLQVSSSLSFPAIEFELKPIDIYLICSFLRRHKADRSPRSLRYELRPNKRVKIVFEPWEIPYEMSTVYTGKNPIVVRTWGRRRLFLLERLLPLVDTFHVRLLGKGMPSFYIAEMDGMSFTLGLSGWTANDWSGGVSFSAISNLSNKGSEDVINYLMDVRKGSINQIREQFPEVDEQVIKDTFGYLYRKGRAFYDIRSQLVRYRELEKDIPAVLTESSELEIKAKNLIKNVNNYESKSIEDGSIQITGSFSVSGEDVSILTLSEDGLFLKANCYCREFKRKQRTPCEHLLALSIISLQTDRLPA